MPIIVWHGGDPGSPNAGNAFGTAALARLEQFRQEDRQDGILDDRYAQQASLNDADNYAAMERTNFAEQGRDRRQAATMAANYTNRNEMEAGRNYRQAKDIEGRAELDAQRQRGMGDRAVAAGKAALERLLVGNKSKTDLQNDKQDYESTKQNKNTPEAVSALMAQYPKQFPTKEAASNYLTLRGVGAVNQVGSPGGGKAAAISAEVKSVIQDLENQRDYYRKAAMEEKDANKRADLNMKADQEQQKINRLLRAQEQAAPPAAPSQQPPAMQQPADIDPNAIHAAAVRLASENPTWTRDQIKAAIQAMMGNR